MMFLKRKICLASIAGFFAEGENASWYVMVQHPPPPLHLASVLLALSGHSCATVRYLKVERLHTAASSSSSPLEKHLIFVGKSILIDSTG